MANSRVEERTSARRSRSSAAASSSCGAMRPALGPIVSSAMTAPSSRTSRSCAESLGIGRPEAFVMTALMRIVGVPPAPSFCAAENLVGAAHTAIVIAAAAKKYFTLVQVYTSVDTVSPHGDGPWDRGARSPAPDRAARLAHALLSMGAWR